MKIFLKKSYARIKNLFLAEIIDEKSKMILDLGCGDIGNFLGLRSAAYTGLDISARAICRAREKARGDFIQADVLDLDFPVDNFDYVVSVSLMHHLKDEDVDKVLKKVSKFLKPEGKLLIADGVYPEAKLNVAGQLIRFLDKGRYVRNKNRLKDLLSKRFVVEKEYYFQDKIFAYGLFVLRHNNKSRGDSDA